MDYKIRLKAYQDQAGDEDAKVKITINDVVFSEETTITATSAVSSQNLDFEISGVNAPSDSTFITVQVELLNDYYVDSSTDRNVNILGGLQYVPKNTALNAYALPVKRGDLSEAVAYIAWEDPMQLPSTMDSPADFSWSWLGTSIESVTGNDGYTVGNMVSITNNDTSTITINLPVDFDNSVSPIIPAAEVADFTFLS
jgi:hypothetical protein